MRRYELSGGDDGAYGLAFGPVNVFEIGVVEDADGKGWQIVQLENVLEYEGQHIEYFVLSPRHTGDRLGTLREMGCTVGIGRVLPGQIDRVRNGDVADNVQYLAVGSSRRIEL